MSKLNIACLLSPMADTEGPMEIIGGNVLSGPKKIMGKYGEVGLEAAITFGETFPGQTRLDLLTIGEAKEVQALQQGAIAMIQPKDASSLGVHAVELDDIQKRDAFAVAEMLAAMVQQLPERPNLIFVGRESWDYAHGVVGPALAQLLGLPYYSGVNEIKPAADLSSVSATVISGNDKFVYNVALPAVFGTTDWLNGKDSARFTSLKGVMAAKKFTRNIMSVNTGAANRSAIDSIAPVKSERRNQVLKGADGSELAKQAFEILVNKDKTLNLGGTAASAGHQESALSFAAADLASLNLAGDVVVLADHANGAVRLSTHQTLSQARKLADALGKNVSLLVLCEQAASISGVAGHGADRVIAIEDASLKYATVENHTAWLRAILPGAPAALVTVANDLGRDVAAYMASAFGAGVLQDISGLTVAGGKVSGTRVVSNARFTTIESLLTGIPVISVRPTAFDPLSDNRAVTCFKLTGVAAPKLQSNLSEVVAGEATKGIPLNEAKIIVSGGRGMKAADNFKHLHNLADLLGGTVGASRAVTDLEWVPHNLQIGQTGTTVAPDVYFAIGISGAIQHLTGMISSKYIVAINSDGDAPIHKHADLSIIEKWENVVPTLIELVQKAR